MEQDSPFVNWKGAIYRELLAKSSALENVFGCRFNSFGTVSLHYSYWGKLFNPSLNTPLTRTTTICETIEAIR